MKKIFTLVFVLAAFFSAQSQSTTVVISQVYGGAGCGTAGCSVYQNDYIEIFNKSASPVDLTGYSVQYASATGTAAWTVTNLSSVTLAPGQYYLVAESNSANGVNPLPAPDATGTIAMSATAGKIALVNSTVALTGTQLTPSASVVDLVGYGSTANGFEGAPAPAPSTANAIFRGGNGCNDTQSNSTDFTAAAAVPRNSLTTPAPCGGGSSPLIVASPGALNFTSNVGTASAQQFYNLSGSNLTPAGGNIVVTPSTGLEISLTTGSGFTNAALNVPYTSGTLTATPVYVRLSNTAAQGSFTGTITNAGGGATTSTINVTGGVYQNYYNTKSNAGLTNLATWSTTVNGAGASPSSFTAGYQNFNIINQANANYSGVWDVSNAGNTTKVIVGDDINPITLTDLPGVDSITTATRIDVLNNATIILQNNRRPFLNILSTGSTVDYAQTGLTTADTIKPAAVSYYHLKLSNGIKVLAGNTTTVRGNLTINNVINFNGPGGSPFATLNVLGNLFITGTTTFEPTPSGDAGRITLRMNGAGTQTITGNGNNISFYKLFRDSTSASNIQLGSAANLVLGNSSTTAGGLALTPANSILSVNGNNLTLLGSAISTASALGKIDIVGGNITIAKSVGAANAGTLRFTAGSEINQFNIAFDPAFTRDSITVADSVYISGALNLTKGKLLTPNKLLIMEVGSTINGGSSASFVEGLMEWNTASANSFIFPIGKANNYRPITVTPNSAASLTYQAQYFATGFVSQNVTSPLTAVSNSEYWTVGQTANNFAMTTISFSLNGTSVNTATASDKIGVAQFDLGVWGNASGTFITPGDATTGTTSSFPLIFGSARAFTFGVQPAAAGSTYTFNGNGNWDNPANWSNGTVPPATLPSGSQIVIDPSAGGECVLNVTQHISVGATFTVKTGKVLRLPQNLILQ